MDKIKNYDNYFVNNALSIFLYKSGRKNSKCELLNAYHLIKTGDDSRKISNDRILSQFAETLSASVNYFKKNNHIEFKILCSFGRQETYKNVYGNLYGNIDTIRIDTGRREAFSIETYINVLFDYYCLIYPYNTISRRELFNNSSIKYYINLFYKKEV